MGIFVYADDLIIWQRMVSVSEGYMNEHKKTKCIYFASSNSDSREMIKKVEVAGKIFSWVQHAVHLGNTLHEDGSMEQDV